MSPAERASTTTKTAKAIVDAETKSRNAKTEKLKAARLERDIETEKDASTDRETRFSKRTKP